LAYGPALWPSAVLSVLPCDQAAKEPVRALRATPFAEDVELSLRIG
jgi:hypothetical protein